jgi:uncharacterized integral membrane protein (TIGR00698 family)
MDRVPGILLAIAIAVPSWILARTVDGLGLIGAPIIAILAGMVVGHLVSKDDRFRSGASFTSKYVLQAAVVLLGFGLNITTIGRVGLGSLPVIVCTISSSLIVAYILYRVLNVPSKTTTLIGVGSSICGGSAIAATAPVIKADDQHIAQSIAVIFLFNVIAAITFPTLGDVLGMSDEGFALFAGTAINDTSSVTAAASTWDAIHGTGHQVLDSATIVKLTRTLFIIPIVIILSYVVSKRGGSENKGDIRKAFPKFILLFLLASVITSLSSWLLEGDHLVLAENVFSILKGLSSFMIVIAMAAIGLNTDVGKMVKAGPKPMMIGLCCWVSIIATSLMVQYTMGVW